MARVLGASIILPPTGTDKSAVHVHELKRGTKLGEKSEHVGVFDVMSQDDIGRDVLHNFTNPVESSERAASRHHLRAVNRICERLSGLNSVDDYDLMARFSEQASDIGEIALHAADDG
jgi:hypothetical protein